jgi:hypothetical protein
MLWKRAADSLYFLLREEDELALTAYDQAWSTTPATPKAYAIMAEPPLTVQFGPPIIDVGTLDVFSVNSGAMLDPTVPVVLGVPDSLAWAIKFGALSDLLGREGPAYDPVCAAFCESRWRLGIAAAQDAALFVHSEINGVPVISSTIEEADSYSVGVTGRSWQNDTGPPKDIFTIGQFIGLKPVPDDVYSIVLDVVRNAPVPTLDTDFLQIGREQVGAILDHAEHLAAFKCGGDEFRATLQQEDNFLKSALAFNKRLAVASRYLPAALENARSQAIFAPTIKSSAAEPVAQGA